MCRLFSTGTEKVNFHIGAYPNFLYLFLVIRLEEHQSFLTFFPFFYTFLRNLSFFASVFDPHITKLQLQLHNSPFTTADIVISYTLKYALPKCCLHIDITNMYRPKYSSTCTSVHVHTRNAYIHTYINTCIRTYLSAHTILT